MPGSFQGYNKKMFLLIQDISSRGRVFTNCHRGKWGGEQREGKSGGSKRKRENKS